MLRSSKIKYYFIIALMGLGILGTPADSAGPSALEPASGLTVSPGANGELQTVYQIEVPPGTQGMQPSLFLFHSADGIAGNWELGGFGRIERRGQYYFFNGGRLVHDGFNYVTKPFDGSQFQPVGDCSYSCYFKHILTDGTIEIYGQKSENRVGTNVWMLESEQDLNGNKVTYSYAREGARFYPESVEYTSNGAVSLASRTVEFEYEDQTNIPQFHAGLPSTNVKHLTSIDAIYEGRSIFRYELQYTNNKLVRIQRYIEGQIVEEPVRITYQSAPLDYHHVSIPTATGMGMPDPFACSVGASACLTLQLGNATPGSVGLLTLACAGYQLENWCDMGDTRRFGDLDGDGISDIVAAENDGGSWVASLLKDTNSAGTYRGPTNFGAPGSHFLLDMNRDGKADLVRLRIIDGQLLGPDSRYGQGVSQCTASCFGGEACFEPPAGMGLG